MSARIVLICAFAVIAGCGGGGIDGPPPGAKFLYASVASQNSDGTFSAAIYAFGVHDHGTLSPVSGSPFAPTSNSPIAITRDSKFLYSGDSTDKLSAFVIHSDGSLTAVPGSPFATSGAVLALVTHPMADFLYVSGYTATGVNTFTVYAINSATGAISPTAYTPGNDSLNYVGAFTPDGRYLYGYVYGDLPPQIRVASTDPATGALSRVPVGPVEALNPGDFAPGPMAIDPAGKFLYVGNVRSGLAHSYGGLYAYSIDAGTGALTPVPGSPFYPGGSQSSLAIDASGKFVIVDCLSVLSINPDTGALTSVPGSPFGQEYCGSVAADPSGPYVYIGTDDPGGVFTYVLDQVTGPLAQISGQDVPGLEVNSIALTH